MAKETNKNFALRVDAATMDALERWAGDEFRSINGQLQWIIADALRRSGRVPRGGAKAAAITDVKAGESSKASPASAKTKNEKR